MIAIIPARGGSKRIPRKNIKSFLGIPMLSHTIKQVRDSQLFSRVVVSTEDLEISKIAQNAGAEVISRNSILANDHATTIDVISDSIIQLSASIDLDHDLVCCIYPVTPTLYPAYINKAVQLLRAETLDFVFSAKQFESSPARSFRIGKDGFPEMSFPENLNVRTQDVPIWYRDAALFYLGRARAWADKNPILTGNSKFIEIGKYENLDVDDETDWELMVNIFQHRQNLKE